MSIVQMSLYGSAFIIATAAIRLLGKGRLPRRTYVVLWMLAGLRLIVPIHIPSPFSIYNVTGSVAETAATEGIASSGSLGSAVIRQVSTVGQVSASESHTALNTLSILAGIWVAGIIVLVLYFAVRHVKSTSVFKYALPVENEFIRVYCRQEELRRRVSVRYSDLVISPLTYGLFSPVILLPKKLDWSDERNLMVILTHEFEHIRRFDIIKKLLLLTALCLHWFNPLVWLMFILANRDIELSCDEAVIIKLGLDNRTLYARALLDIEESRLEHYPMISYFSKNVVKERISAIIKYKKICGLSIAAAFVIVAATIAVFATSAVTATADTSDSANVTEASETYTSSIPISYCNKATGEETDTDSDGNKLDVDYILSIFGQYGLTYDKENDLFMYGDTFVSHLTYCDGAEDIEAYYLAKCYFSYISDGLDSMPDFDFYYILKDESANITGLMSSEEFYENTGYLPTIPQENVELLLSRCGEYGLIFDSELNCFMFEEELVNAVTMRMGEKYYENYSFSLSNDGICLTTLVDKDYNIIGLAAGVFETVY